MTRIAPAAGLVLLLAALAACTTDSVSFEAARAQDDANHSIAHDEAYVLDHTMARIDGSEEDLSTYEGKVLLVVNVASRCGLTPQYEGLEALYERYHDRGFEVLGFPANNFREQEPGTNEEIHQFCTSRYGVTFPMFAKISVKGDDMDPLYRDLTGQPAPIGGDPDWNFTKFLVDRNGRVVARFHPRVTPDDMELVNAIERLLDQG